MTAPLLTVVSAGLGQPSATRRLADRLARATGDRLAATGPAPHLHVTELREQAGDIAHHLVTGFPSPGLRRELRALERADGVIAVTPVFAASYSGLFKSYFDLAEPGGLAGTPVLLAATGGTARHTLALEHVMRPLFTYLRAAVVPTAVFAATEDWDGTGDALTDALTARVDRAAGELATWMRTLPGTRPGPEGPVTPFTEQLARIRPH